MSGHEPRDLRLLTPAAAVWVAAACCTALRPRALLVVAGLALTVGLLVVCLRERCRTAAAVVVAAAVLVAAVAGVLAARAATARAGPLGGLAARHADADLDLLVTGDPQSRESVGGYRYVVLRATVVGVRRPGRVVRVRSPVVVVAHGPGWASLLPSTRVRASVRVSPASSRGDVTAVVLAAAPPTVTAPPSWVQRLAGRVRGGLREACRGLPGATRGLVPGLVIGDVSALPARVRNEFRVTGLTHLYAVSGTNVAVVVGATLLLARRLRAGPRLGAVLAAGALVVFVVIARPSPSVLRAGVMGLVVLAGFVSGRRAAPVPALGAAVVMLLLVDPGLARQAGFALSVLATLGILLIAPAWRDRLARRLPAPAAEALAVPAAAQLACAPILVAYFGQVSLVSVPANLLAALAVPPATILGVVAGLSALVSQPLARDVARLAAIPALWLVSVAHVGAHVPAASLAWPSGWAGVLALAVAGLATRSVVATGRRSRRLMAVLCASAVVWWATGHGAPSRSAPSRSALSESALSRTAASASTVAHACPRVGRAILAGCQRPPP